MTARGEMPKFSALSYIVEPPSLWSETESGPRWTAGSDGGHWLVGYRKVPLLISQVQALVPSNGTRQETVRLDEVPAEAFTPKHRLQMQEKFGVVGEVLYPTPALWHAMTLSDDTDWQTNCARVYNQWLAEYCSALPERLVGVGQIPAGVSASTAISVLEECKSLGLGGAQLRSIPTDDSGDNSGIEAFWAAAEGARIPLSIDSTFGQTRPRRLGQEGGLGPVIPAAGTAAVQIVQSGIIDRHSQLRFVIAAASAGWVPAWLERTDDGFLRFAGLRSVELKRSLPSDYLNGANFWYTFSGSDLILEWPDTYVSSSRLLWGSQYPTQYSTSAEESVPSDAVLSNYDSAAQGRVMGGNCRSLYSIGGVLADVDDVKLPPLMHGVPA